MYTDQYVRESLELHLFSGRIMKEHALFLEAGFTQADPSFARQAEMFKGEFEKLLCHAVSLAEGSVSGDFWKVEDAVTPYTAEAERKTAAFTGIGINTGITVQERRLAARAVKGCEYSAVCARGMEREIHRMNQTALRLLDGLISLKEMILRDVLSCRMFTANYPLLIEHILREAKLYRENVEALENTGRLPRRSEQEEENFWNRIMKS